MRESIRAKSMGGLTTSECNNNRCRKLMVGGKHNDMQYAENQRIRERKRDANKKKKNRSVQALRGQERRPQALRRSLLL